jgi:hypothetical protein
MRRIATRTCLFAAAWAVLLAAPAVASPAAVQALGIRPGSFVVFTTATADGPRVLVEGGNGRTTIWVGNRTQRTGYRVDTDLSSGRLRASFGSFGRIDVRFKPTKVLSVERPAGGCGGIVSQYELGVFTGVIRFRGEQGYVDVDASRTDGEVVNSARYDCADPPPTVRHSSHRTLDERVLALGRLERESEGGHRAVLRAENGRRLFAAIATKHGGAIGPAYFFGGLVERHAGMRIFREAAVKAPPSTFLFDLAAGAATVSPPFPFSGTASLARSGAGTKTWLGTLAVDLLGAEPSQLTGQGFQSFLGADFTREP